MNERKKISRLKKIWGLITLLIIILPIIITFLKPKLTLVSSSLEKEDSSTTLYELTLLFNQRVDYGDVEIILYDSEGQIVDEITEFFNHSGKEVSSLLTIDKDFESYVVESYDFEIQHSIFLLYILLGITLPIFISTFFIQYKEYKFKDNIISVYAGYTYHFLKINGEIYDEYRELFSLTPIKLNTILDDNTKIEATISTSNHIFLKINDKLYNKLNK